MVNIIKGLGLSRLLPSKTMWQRIALIAALFLTVFVLVWVVLAVPFLSRCHPELSATLDTSESFYNSETGAVGQVVNNLTLLNYDVTSTGDAYGVSAKFVVLDSEGRSCGSLFMTIVLMRELKRSRARADIYLARP
ncbi:MAG: hypothetical protein PVI21_02090 [Candidatus Woesebacteria bacterium]